MAVCPGCGWPVGDQSECPHCRYTPIIGGTLEETTSLFDKKISTGEKNLNIFLKVISILFIMVITGIGPLIGLIGGLILMESYLESRRSFGKLLVQVSLVLISLALLCFLGILLYWMPGLW